MGLPDTGVVIWGAGGHAKVVADIVRLEGRFQIEGFIDELNPDRAGEAFCGSLVIGGRECLEILRKKGILKILPGFGDCRRRSQLNEELRTLGFVMPNVIHPRATVAADVCIDGGTIIAAGAVVGPGVRLGRSVIINTAASVDHDCVLGDAVHVCPGAHLAGGVIIGEASQIGIGAVVIDGVCIGAQSLIGAGAVVTKNIPESVVAYGVPAHIKREHLQ
ncbi:MAG: acetyltransferase [Bacteroidia bacterium]|nr:acetyltransferase [Bacteroidia bacterium]